MKEIWKEIEGYENYLISNLGRIYTKRRQKVKGGIRKCYMLKTGYRCINISRDGKYYRVSIHRLVAKAFIPNPLNLPQVNHINGIKTDNRVENLEWVTHDQNYLHANKILNIEACKNKPIIGTNKKSGEKIKFRSTHEAVKHGFNRTAISGCCKHRKYVKSHYGYTWEYDTENL